METAKAHAGSLPEAEVEPRTPLSPVLKSLYKISLQQPLSAPILLHPQTGAWISASEPDQDQQHSGGSLGMPGTFWISLGH